MKISRFAHGHKYANSMKIACKRTFGICRKRVLVLKSYRAFSMRADTNYDLESRHVSFIWNASNLKLKHLGILNVERVHLFKGVFHIFLSVYFFVWFFNVYLYNDMLSLLRINVVYLFECFLHIKCIELSSSS